MRILPRVLITVFVLLGIAFAVMLSFSSCQHEANYAAGKAGCEAAYVYKFGVDANGCDSPVLPFPTDSQDVEDWLNAHGVSKECYKIRFWNKGHLEHEIGNLAAIQCIAKKGDQSPELGWHGHGPSGSGGTQRVMFNTPTARETFERKIKGAKN
jgi:hypothetical protein